MNDDLTLPTLIYSEINNWFWHCHSILMEYDKRCRTCLMICMRVVSLLIKFDFYTPIVWVGAILQSPCPSVHSHFRNRYLSFYWKKWFYIFDIWLWHGDLYCVSPFQVYHTSTSCLQCDLEFFMFAVMKTFVTVISASTGRNDFIFYIWLWHGDLYRVSPF